MENLWFFGATAALTTILACWRQAWAWAQQVYSRVVVTAFFPGYAGGAVMMYLRENCVESRFGPRTYIAAPQYIKPMRRHGLVPMERLGVGTRVFWKGWKPIWLSRSTMGVSPGSNQAMTADNLALQLTFFRGTFSTDELAIDAVDQLNRLYQGRTDRSRFSIRHVQGQDGKESVALSGEANRPPDVFSRGGRVVEDTHEMMDLAQNRILKWKITDLGPDRVVGLGASLDRMALSPEARKIVQEVKVWLKSEAYCRECGLPWKRSYGIMGPPGTGKSSLIRAIAEDFDLPVFLYDLPTLYNDELQREWRSMAQETPCIAVMEDVDAIFEGRTNVLGAKSHLTFECLLNVLDGVDRVNGLLVFITSNHPEKLDPAIGGQGVSGEIGARPGRIDRVLHMVNPDEAGRRQMAQRILKRWPDLIESTVLAGVNDTGAQFEYRCQALGSQLYWHEHEDLDDGRPTETGSARATRDSADAAPLALQETHGQGS